MGFNPLKERGTPIDKQIRNWSQLNVKPEGEHPVVQLRERHHVTELEIMHV